MMLKITKELATQCHAAARDNGWYDTTPDWRAQLAYVMGEIFEAENTASKGRFAAADAWDKPYAAGLKNTVQDELADVVIRIADFLGWQGYQELTASRTAFAHFETLAQAAFLTAGKLYLETFIGLGWALAFVQFACERLGVPVDDVMRTIPMKLEYNKTRGKKHGKEQV